MLTTLGSFKHSLVNRHAPNLAKKYDPTFKKEGLGELLSYAFKQTVTKDYERKQQEELFSLKQQILFASDNVPTPSSIQIQHSVYGVDYNNPQRFNITVQAEQQNLKVTINQDSFIVENMSLLEFTEWAKNSQGIDLSGLDRSYGGAWSNMNLTGSNFRGATLSSSISRWGGRGFELKNINLSGSDFTDATLRNVDFSNVDMSYVTLRNTIFDRKVEECTNYYQARSESDRTYEYKYKGANLSGIRMQGATVENVNLREAKLNSADMAGTHMRTVDLSSADLRDADFWGVTFDGVNLALADLDKTNFSNANFKNMDLLKVQFKPTTNLDRASIHLDLPRTWDKNTLHRLLDHISNDDSLLMAINRIDDKYQDLKISLVAQIIESLKDIDISSIRPVFLEALDRPVYLDSKKMNALDSEVQQLDQKIINTQDQAQKLESDIKKLQADLVVLNNESRKAGGSKEICQPQGAQIAELKKKEQSLTRLNNELNNLKQQKTEKEAILSSYRKVFATLTIEATNTSPLRLTKDSELKLFLDMVENKNPQEQEKFMLGNNGFFVQLLYLCSKRAHNDALYQKAAKLYDVYIHLKPLDAFRNIMLGRQVGLCVPKPGVQKPGSEKGTLRINKQKPESIKSLEGIEDLNQAARAFVFVSKNTTTGKYDGLFLSQQEIDGLLHTGEDCAWDMMLFVTNDQVVKQADIKRDEILQLFKLFQPAYAFPDLLNLLNLKHENIAGATDLPSKDYTGLFREAIRQRNSSVKLTSEEDQSTLKKIFEPLFVEQRYSFNDEVDRNARMITDAHYQQILEVFKLSKSTNLEKAHTLFCLATIFAKYASSPMFGNEYESPRAVREYAGALLIKAYELDKSVFGNTPELQATNFKQWLTDMVGGILQTNRKQVGGTCMNGLYSQLISHINGHSQKELAIKLTRLKPLAW